MKETSKAPHVLALIASNQTPSIHRQLVEAMAPHLQSAHIDWLDMMPFDELPLYSRRRQDAGFPEAVMHFYERIAAADAIIIATPEHNGSIPAVFKNLIDWISRHDMKFLQQKPVLLLSTSKGPNGGATNLQQMAKLIPFWGANVINVKSFGGFYEHITEQGADAETDAELKVLAEELLQAVPTPQLIEV